MKKTHAYVAQLCAIAALYTAAILLTPPSFASFAEKQDKGTFINGTGKCAHLAYETPYEYPSDASCGFVPPWDTCPCADAHYRYICLGRGYETCTRVMQPRWAAYLASIGTDAVELRKTEIFYDLAKKFLHFLAFYVAINAVYKVAKDFMQQRKLEKALDGRLKQWKQELQKALVLTGKGDKAG